MTDPAYLLRPDGERLAYRRSDGRGPGILWLGGFRSDMTGSKAAWLAEYAAREGRSFVRFDYFGHGASSGAFEDGTISRWRDDALAVLDTLTEGPQLVVGSSMGGWMAMLLAHARPKRVAGMVLIAPAADFTEELMWKRAPDAVQAEILAAGRFTYSDGGYTITRALIDSGRDNLVLDKRLDLRVPVRILHGDADGDVPWQHGARLMQVISGRVTFTLIKGGDHRLSTPADLDRMEAAVGGVLQELGS